MDRPLEVTYSTSSDRFDIPTDMQLNSIKQEDGRLVQSKIDIKTEPNENVSEFPVIAGTSYGMCSYNEKRLENNEPMIKVEREDQFDEFIQDPLDVGSEIKDEGHSLIDLKQGEPRIKTEPMEEVKYENLLKTDQDDSHGSRTNLRQNQLLIRHNLDHRDKKYVCNICNKTCRQKVDLDRHLRIHTGEKPFNCYVCKKSFALKGDMNKHMLIHIGEKPYACDVCQKVFRDKSAVNKHKLIHSGMKYFSCKECGKSFIQKSNFIRHEQTHTKEKSFICDLCHKGFTQKLSLIEHRRLHTGEKPYSCNICYKLFAQKSTFNKHMKKHKN